MLPDRLTQLLTAYVDGELSARQRKGVLRLLRRSPEARELLRKLQEDSAALRQLPCLPLDRDLSETVLASISVSPAQPVRRRPETAAAIPSWTGLAVAASVLLVIGVGSYLYFTAAENWHGGSLASVPGADGTGKEQPSPAPWGSNVERPVPSPPERLQVLPSEIKVARGPLERPSPEPESPVPPEPPKKDGGVFATRDPNPRHKVVEVPRPRLPFIIGIRELGQAQAASQFQQEWSQESAYRAELFCLDGARALDRLETVLRQHKVRLILDTEAVARRKVRAKTDYVVYAEGIGAEEWSRILIQVGTDDRKAEERKAGDGQFGKCVIHPLGASDQEEMSRLLGIDASSISLPVRKASAGTGGNSGQLVENGAGQGGTRPTGQPSAGKPAPRTAILVCANPPRAKPAASREIKQFLDGRKDSVPLCPMMLVLRNAAG